MLVAEFMTRGAISVMPDATLAEAVRILMARNIRRLTVVWRTGHRVISVARLPV